jgi:RNA ligase (TIGR02306 family)
MTRKLVTIKTITDISPIPDADAIDVVTVDHGWKVVVKKEDNYQLGEKVLYFEVDSWVPHRIAPFLSKGQEPREYEGVKGERLRTIKLRGATSQGLVLKFEYCGGISAPYAIQDGKVLFSGFLMNEDKTFTHKETEENLAEVLRVQKWEAPVPAQLSGKVKGNFPSFIPKTDQERCQNLYTEIFEEHYGEEYEITEKLEGTSMTVYVKDGEVGVCSRNWNLSEDDSNTLWSVAKSSGLVEFLPQLASNIAIQGELIGEGIQKNYYGIKGHKFYIFDIYDIDEGRYYTPKERIAFVQLCNPIHKLNLHHIPLIITDQGKIFENKMESLLSFAEGKSVINYNKQREGVVFKSKTSDFHFKTVSNTFLLKTGG